MEASNIEDTEQEQQPAAATSACREVRLDIADDHYVLRRVPRWVREDNEHAYVPKFICIGPYHSGGTGGECLQHEELKRRYANELLEDAGADDEAGRCRLKQICHQKLTSMSGYIREFYAGGTQNMTTDKLVQMMFQDGCFIIKHLYNYGSGIDDKELYQSTWAPAQLRIDLLLLENQMPFAVLVALFEHLAPWKLKLRGADEEKKRARLLDMALWYMLNQMWTFPDKPTKELEMEPDVPIDHLLHLLHEAHCAKLRVARKLRSPEEDRRQRLASGGGYTILLMRILLMRILRWLCLCHWETWPDDTPDSKENIPSAAELEALGIRFKMVKRDGGGLLDVRFRKDRLTLEIPSLYVGQTTAPVLQNLIAYEQQHVVRTDGEKNPDDHFTTYAFLMYNLVSTREDITLLQKRCILHNSFGSDVKVVEYFKNLCMFNRRSGSTSPIENVLRDLRKCKQQKVYLDWAEVKKYINSPIKVLLLIISALVSLSTVLQALVAVRPAQH